MCVYQRITVAGEISPSQIIEKDEHDVEGFGPARLDLIEIRLFLRQVILIDCRTTKFDVNTSQDDR